MDVVLYIQSVIIIIIIIIYHELTKTVLLLGVHKCKISEFLKTIYFIYDYCEHIFGTSLSLSLSLK